MKKLVFILIITLFTCSRDNFKNVIDESAKGSVKLSVNLGNFFIGGSGADSPWNHIYQESADITFSSTTTDYTSTVSFNPNDLSTFPETSLPYDTYSWSITKTGDDVAVSDVLYIYGSSATNFTVDSPTTTVPLVLDTDFALVTVSTENLASASIRYNGTNTDLTTQDGYYFGYINANNTPYILQIVSTDDLAGMDTISDPVAYTHYNYQVTFDTPTTGSVGISLSLSQNFVLEDRDITAEADDDLDGVPNSLDECPDTPSGAVVDENGCTLIQGSLPLDFESATTAYNWVGFGSVDFGEIPSGVVPNPYATGINTSDYVLQISKSAGAQVWAGSTMTLAGPIDFASGTTIKMKVWSPRVGTPILFKVEDTSSPLDGNGNPTIFGEFSTTTTVANAWEELSFDMYGLVNPTKSYSRISVFPDFGTVGFGENFYFDDIALSPYASILPGLPLDFESSSISYNWIGYGGVSFAGVIDNPYVSVGNNSGKVLQLTKSSGAEAYAGASMLLAGPIDFSSSTVISIKFWSPDGSPFVIRIENADDAAIYAEGTVYPTIDKFWEIQSAYFVDSLYNPNNSYNRITIIPDAFTMGQGETFYFDDISVF